MKLPLAPPRLAGLSVRLAERIPALLSQKISPEVNGRYEHWDRLRLLPAPEGLSHDLWWLGIKLSRKAIARTLPLNDKLGRPITISVTDSLQRSLHLLDRETAGAIAGLDRADDPGRRRYLFRSLVEEAMTSAQLEGAATTREVAKAMLRSGRTPRDRGEQMIFNNYRVMQQLQDICGDPLTPELIFRIHRELTEDALDDPSAAGRFRRSDEQIRVIDHRDGTVLHDPPPADQLSKRLQALCDFANAGSSDAGEFNFLHPVLRAIALHFQMGYDHPFVDGNGRTARALFYWAMLRSGYWLTEFLSISSVLRKAPAQYSRAYLLTETDESDLSYFAAHQLAVIEKAVEGLHDYIARKTREQRSAEAVLNPGSSWGSRLNHRQRELLVDALRKPGRLYRIAEHQGRHRVTYQTARSDLLSLAEAGLLTRHSQGRAFVFEAKADLAERLGV